VVGPRQPGLLDKGLVLHTRAYRETSLMVDVFTQEHGRFRLIAKGARRGRGPLIQVLRPFAPIRLSFTGRGELKTLTAAESLGSMRPLSGKALFCGFYIAELLIRLLPTEDAHPDLFERTIALFQAFAESAALDQLLRHYEIALLEELGYGLRLNEDRGGLAIDPQGDYLFDLEKGALKVQAATPLSVSGATLLGLEQGTLAGDRERLEAKRLMRKMVDHLLEGRPLRSRELFQSLKVRSLD